MVSEIHSTAIIEKGAEIDEGVTIGPYAFVGGSVRIGKGTNVMHHATVDGRATLGMDNEVHPYAYVGAKTHDLKYEGGMPGLRIGNRNTFREYTTIHCATAAEDETILGDDNVILAYSHVAHDCIIGNNLVMSSHAALAGHVVIGNHVNFAWGAGIHQFSRVGDYAMVGATAKVVQDVPPFMIADGSPATVRTINKVGLERAGFSPDEISLIRKIFKTFYKEGLNRSQAIDKLRSDEAGESPLVKQVIGFVESSERGVS